MTNTLVCNIAPRPNLQVADIFLLIFEGGMYIHQLKTTKEILCKQ